MDCCLYIQQGCPAEVYHTSRFPGTDECVDRTMPRVFGTEMTNSDANRADTAFYGVDVDAQGTIIAAGMTYEGYLIANDQGISM